MGGRHIIISINLERRRGRAKQKALDNILPRSRTAHSRRTNRYTFTAAAAAAAVAASAVRYDRFLLCVFYFIREQKRKKKQIKK